MGISSCSPTENKNGSEEDHASEISFERLNKDKMVIQKGIIEEDKLESFKGLQYFDIDKKYRIKAGIHSIEKKKVVFKTTTDRMPEYYTVFELRFNVDGQNCRLTAYSEKENPDGEALFIPFKDATSNQESYGGGRYVEVPYNGEKDSVAIDFNKAYNPYCHYNHSYSCPLVPEENRIPAAIRAGEKKLYP